MLEEIEVIFLSMEGRESPGFVPRDNQEARKELSGSSRLIAEYFDKHPYLMAISLDKMSRLSKEELRQEEEKYAREWNECANIVVRSHDEGVTQDLRNAIEGRLETLRETRDVFAQLSGKPSETWREFTPEDLAKIAADNDARQDAIDRGHVRGHEKRRVA